MAFNDQEAGPTCRGVAASARFIVHEGHRHSEDGASAFWRIELGRLSAGDDAGDDGGGQGARRRRAHARNFSARATRIVKRMLPDASGFSRDRAGSNCGSQRRIPATTRAALPVPRLRPRAAHVGVPFGPDLRRVVPFLGAGAAPGRADAREAAACAPGRMLRRRRRASKSPPLAPTAAALARLIGEPVAHRRSEHAAVDGPCARSEHGHVDFVELAREGG